MDKNEKNFKYVTDQRKFTMVYNDFLESNKLSATEKILFIMLKKYANENSKCFPSLKTLADKVGISKQTVITTLDSMEKKGVIHVEKRYNKKTKVNASNMYTLYDIAEMWRDEEKEVIEEIKEEELLLKLAKKYGYNLLKKEDANGQTNKETQKKESAPQQANSKKNYKNVAHQILANSDSITIGNKSQDKKWEKYSMDDIKERYEYDILSFDYPESKDYIDICMQILYDIINTQKDYIVIAGERKPKNVVVSVMLKLDSMDIRYAIEKYMASTSKITNQIGYMTTLLYNAKVQQKLEIDNQVRIDWGL